jgi:activator of HSP90 ATPase
MKSKTTTITQKVILPVLPEMAYIAFLDSKKHSEFTKSKATGKGVVGSKFTAGDGYIVGRNLELEEGKRILQEWVTMEWPEGYPPSKLELTFKKAEDNTELTMVQSGVPIDQEEGLRQGWIKHYWEPLKTYFEKRKGKEATKS